jgi:hypothetical protein
MNRILASERRSGKLAATIGDYFIDVHVELCTASRHPDVQRKHILVLVRKDLVTRLHNELKTSGVESISGMIGYGGRLLQSGIRRNHFARHQILADAEVFEGSLRLGAPEFFGRNVDLAEAITLLPNIANVPIHASLPFS